MEHGVPSSVVLPLVNRLKISCPIVLHQGVERIRSHGGDGRIHRRIHRGNIHPGEARARLSLKLLRKRSVVVWYRSLKIFSEGKVRRR